MTNSDELLTATLALPVAMLLACLSGQVRNGMMALLALAPVAALEAALLVPSGTTLVFPEALLGLTFVLDAPGAMLLGTAALLWIGAGAYAGAYLQGNPNGGQFAVWWLMTLTGNIGVFIAADIVSFYLFFTLVSLAAYGLIVHGNSKPAKRAGAIYIALALLSEAFLLMGFVLLAAPAPNGSLLIRDAVASLSTSPWRDPALALLILGFGLKIGLAPLHVWMPLTYTAAPVPVAAVLSGAAVKAGVIGLIRFLPFDTTLPGWGEALATMGLFSAFFGVVIGITQANPKTVLAYSSVSQMGLLAAVLGMGLAAGDKSVSIAAAFYAVRHILVKGGLFLAIGVLARSRRRGLWLVMVPAAVLALGFGGLPLTGGTVAKLAIKAPLGGGAVGTIVTLAAVGSTLLMLHFLRCLMLSAPRESGMAAPAGLALPWLAIALASVAAPLTLYPVIADESLRDALAPEGLWAALWPVLTGGLLAVPLWRWGYFLPRIPEGDILVAVESTAGAVSKLGLAIERIDGRLGEWPVVGLLFLGLTIILAGIMLAGR